MAKNFVSNSQESVRMFKNSFLESLSKVHYFVPIIIFVPVIFVCTYLAFDKQIGVLNYIGLFLFGLFVWTFTEYIMHRFVFHFVPKQKWALRLHFIFHGVHHDYPSDAMRLVMPPSASIPLATGFYFLFNALLPANYIFGFFTGFTLGYRVNDIPHKAIHHFNFKGSFWKTIKQHH